MMLPTILTSPRLYYTLLCLGMLVAALGTPAPSATAAPELPRLSVSVLQYGTAHWELYHLKRAGLDTAEGFELDVRLVANLPASRLAVSSGEVDGAVADLLWVQSRYENGDPFLYLPFSSQIGDVLVSPDSDIDEISDLVGQRIGVAGSPLSKGWILLQEVAQREGINIERQARVQYAAPPLLSQALIRGQVDVLITYWHFAARLRADGRARTAFRMEELLVTLGFDRDLPVLGYVFRNEWAEANPALLARFSRALTSAKSELATNAEHWQAIRPLMRAEDDAVFDELRSGFIKGTPDPLTENRIDDLHRLLILTGTDQRQVMPASLFHRSGQ
ncbi:NitT/TauT family transport system substrate-binding protein [Marinobacter daqiaonensis]|uniref:NitT/TauT family transport system substrate-binding protein n=1 Tax=Marinobacter daqiaonensis TaxID=650891 RepID=A0A1I6HZ17_9GAMM|nr:ABC transporter substrate-binding protein [Marinobacter daqiaonensis]SFR59705.1 NitT/TauT family transport system substrate-binding protein [Marinobacter daqiaonensis]